MSKIIKSVSVVSVAKNPVVIVIPEKPEPTASDLPETGNGTVQDEELEAKEAIDLDAVYEEVLTNARSAADELLSSARQQAEMIVQDANDQAESLNKKAQEEGFQKGFAEGLAQAGQAIEEAKQKAGAIIIGGERLAAETLQSSERQMLELSFAIARKILHREIEENPNVVLPLITAALEKVREQEQVTIKVSLADLETVRQVKPELQATMTGNASLSIVGDEGLKDGDCIIETPFGAVDARIDTQFETLKTVLRDVSNERV